MVRWLSLSNSLPDGLSIERGLELLDMLREAEQAFSQLEPSVTRDIELKKIERFSSAIVCRLVSSPRGTVHYILWSDAEGGKIDFIDMTKAFERKVVDRLTECYGPAFALNLPLNDDDARDMIASAADDPLAWDYVLIVCSNALITGMVLPDQLKVFAGLALVKSPPKPKRGRSKFKNNYRDLVMSGIADHLKTQFGLPLSRGFGSKNDSICSILAEVLAQYGHHLTEDAIRKVIEKKTPIIQTGNNSSPFLSGD